MPRRVLLPIPIGNATNAATRNALYHSCGMLRNMGYEPDVRVLDQNSDWADSFSSSDNGYEFIVAVRQNNVSSGSKYTTLLDGTAVIPTFWTMLIEDGSFFGVTIGVSRATGAGYKVIQDGTLQYGNYITGYTIDGGWESKITVLAYDTATDDLNQFKVVGTNTTVYCESNTQYLFSLLPRLIQHAVDDGLISAPSRRCVVCHDVDDMPNETLTTEADCKALYDIQVANNWPMTWGIHSQNIGSYSQALIDFLKTRTPDVNGLIYLIDHAGSGNNSDWSGPKFPLDAAYRAEIAALNAEGLVTGKPANSGLDNWGYRYFNTNKIGDTGAQLMSPQTALVSSPVNDEEIAGYGHQAFRTSPATTTDVKSPRYAAEMTTHRGMLNLSSNNGISSGDISLTLAANTDKFSTHCVYAIGQACAYRDIFYLHGGNFYDGHSSGNAPGLTALRIIAGLVGKMSDVVQLGHPTEYAARLNIGKALNQVGAF